MLASSDRKLEVLKFISYMDEIGLHGLFPKYCRTTAASSLYLLKLSREHLLIRSRVAGKIRYSLSRRGEEQLDYLNRKEDQAPWVSGQIETSRRREVSWGHHQIPVDNPQGCGRIPLTNVTGLDNEANSA